MLKKNNSYVCKLLSPCHGPKKTCGVGGHPTRSGVNNSQNMDMYRVSTKYKIKNGKHPTPRNKIEVQSIYSHQNMTQKSARTGGARGVIIRMA